MLSSGGPLAGDGRRGARGRAALEAAVRDLRQGARSLRGSPLFTLTAVVTLGFTTAAISTVFTIAYTLLLRPLPVDRPEELVVVSATRRQGQLLGSVSYRDYVRLRDHNKTLKGLAAHYSTAPLFVSAQGQAREINGAVVSANFFPLLALEPALGRFFRPDEDRVPDRDHVVVLSHGLWRDWFAASPGALGTTIKVNGVAFTVIGVTPRGFRGLSDSPSQIYLPTMMLRVGYRWCDAFADQCTMLDMIGRLAEGRGVEQVGAEMAGLVPDWAKATEGNTGITVFPARGAGGSEVRGEEAHFVRLLVFAVGVLLLVCCANLAGLLMARGTTRERELAIRASLGAGRGRLVRQLVTEALLLAILGGTLGVLLSLALTRLLSAMFYSVDYAGRPLYFDFSPEPRVILAVLAVAAGAGVLFGSPPAFRSTRVDAAESLKRQASTASPPSRLGRWLVGAQAAAAVALVAVATLLVASARMVLSGTSFEPSRVALIRLRPRLIGYAPEKAQQFQSNVVRRLEAVPGVESVSLVGTGLVLAGGEEDVSLREWPDPDRQALRCGYMEIGPRYFETLRTPLLQGREFDDRDSLGSPPVAVVDVTLARRLWPDGSALGAFLVIRGRPHQVVGVVAGVPLRTRAEAARPYVYVPYWQNAEQVDARYCVRVTGDPAAMLPALVREVNRVDPDVPVANLTTLPVQIQGQIKPVRVSATVLAYAAGLTVLLSALGLYGMLAFSVSRRTKEIGIRMAVGAQSRQVLAMILRDGMRVVLVGIAAGLGLAAGGTRIVRHLLYGSAAGDGAVYGAAGLLVAGAALLACWIPARRAAGVEPVIALREG